MFTSTGVAQHGSAYWGAYGVSKAGADNLMQIMADELEVNTQIRVNSIDPGIVRTRMRRQAYPAEDASRLPTPESIMPGYLYLMGPDSQGETGVIFRIRG
jgi:NAD(P)-dependent dehydrogenase (short-subunit alcohol dehydrogenase family)